MQGKSNGQGPAPWAQPPPYATHAAPAQPVSMVMPETNVMAADSEDGLGSLPALPPPPGAMPSVPAGPPPAPGPADAAQQPRPFVNPMVMGAPSAPLHAVPMVAQSPAMAAGEIPQEGSHTLGLAVLVAGVGAVVGWRFGGAFGSLAGGLIGGSVVNGWRALRYYQEGTDEGDKEAAVSATYAALTAALSGYVIVKHAAPAASKKAEQAAQSLPALPNPEDPPLVDPSGPCALRPVGPELTAPEVVPTPELLEQASEDDEPFGEDEPELGA